MPPFGSLELLYHEAEVPSAEKLSVAFLQHEVPTAAARQLQTPKSGTLTKAF